MILLLTLTYRGPQYRDAVETEVLVMMGLSFPSGWLFFVLLKLIEMLKLLDVSQRTELQWILIAWIPLFVLGYLQWFVVVPASVRWWRTKFDDSSSGSISAVPRG
jgi:ABC-type dipeptide/oligopeptide/nickel transport system permease component